MRAWVKLTIAMTIPIAAIVLLLACWALFHIDLILSSIMGADKFTFYNCPPEEVIARMETAFGLKFPDGVTKIRAAKTPYSEGNTSFVIRFTAEPNVVDALLRSFPGGIRLHEYTRESDFRPETAGAPGWYKDPIQRGKWGCPGPTPSMERAGTALLNIYIDMTDDAKYVVYWTGYY